MAQTASKLNQLSKSIEKNVSQTLSQIKKSSDLRKHHSAKLITEFSNIFSQLSEVKEMISELNSHSQLLPNPNLQIPPELLKPEIHSGSFKLAVDSLQKHTDAALKAIENVRENLHSSIYHPLAEHHIKTAEKSLTLVCDLSRTMHASITMPLDHINTPPELDHPSVRGYGDHANKSRDYFGKRKF